MGATLKGTISCGFKFSIPPERFENYKTLKMLKEADKDPTKILEVVPRLLGEQEDELIEALGGEPSFDQVCQAMREIFDKAKENTAVKKSSPLPN